VFPARAPSARLIPAIAWAPHYGVSAGTADEGSARLRAEQPGLESCFTIGLE
jgi:hypothetical protein